VSTLAHDRAGQGLPVVVLLHGVGGGRAIWSEHGSGTVQALAAAGAQAIAIDLPGYGDSPLPEHLTLPGMADAVASTLHGLSVTHAVIVGHSMGGMVAQLVATRHAALVQGLVLVCTTASFGKADGVWQQGFLQQRLAPLDAGQGIPALAKALVPTLLASPSNAAVLAQGQAVMSRVPERTYRAALAALMGFDQRAALADIAVPTLCIAGEQDGTSPPEVMQRMAQRIAGARFECLANAGHLAPLEQPQAFNDLLIRFSRSPHPNPLPQGEGVVAPSPCGRGLG
jgi:3-oxoadipate enol-lactonase